MGSDDRDAPGNNIDNLTGGGKRSDTTILLHLSADRKRAYGVSIPRDSLVDRPECLDAGLDPIPGATDAMWNEAFSVGGPACTIRQFEELTGIRVDHFVVVDFAGFRGMVDAIGGVQVCIPEPGIDRPGPRHQPPGRHPQARGHPGPQLRARALRPRQRSDIGRMKRQQAFIAAMAHQVLSANTLANPIRLLKFLEAATKSLQLDRGSAASPRSPGWACSSGASASTRSSSSPSLAVRPRRPQPHPLAARGQAGWSRSSTTSRWRRSCSTTRSAPSTCPVADAD